MVLTDGGDHTSSQLWNGWGPCAYGGAPLIGGRGMAMDGCILRAIRSLWAWLSTSQQDAVANNSDALHGAVVVPLTLPLAGLVSNPWASQPPVRRRRKRRFVYQPADQASLLYLSLTRCGAAHTLRTYGPRRTTTKPLSLAPHRGDPGVRDPEGGVSPPGSQQPLDCPFWF